mgnify:CR=1 FL=1
MIKSKKADMSISVIVMAAIGIVVLAVVVGLVLNSTSDITNARSCEGSGTGQCTTSESCDTGQIRVSLSCPDDGEICCRSIGLEDSSDN